MKTYTKVYLDYFKYCTEDFIGCEVCGQRANDIHHILNRSRRPDLLNNIDNIMALCRTCHEQYGDKNKFIDFLKEKHENIKNKFKRKENRRT